MTSDDKSRHDDPGGLDDPWADDGPSQANGPAPGPAPEPGDALGGQDLDLGAPAQAAAKAPGVNYAVLASAALLGLVVVGGAGYYVKSKFFSDSSRLDRREQVELSQPRQAQAPRAGEESVFDQAAARTAQTPSVPAGLDASSETIVPTAGGQSSASTVAAAPSVPPAATVSPAPAAPSTPPSSPASSAQAAQVVSSSTNAEKFGDARAKGAEGAAASSPGACPCEPGKSERIARAAAKPRPAVARVTKAVKPAQESAASKPATAQAAAPVPAPAQRVEIVESAPPPRQKPPLNPGLRVHAVYPLSGPDAQAWVREPSGRTSVVRAGDYFAGVRVTSVVPERGEVHTSSGVIGLHGAR
jgi:hypothetical protein